jgi:hypothetical protein
VRTELGVLTIRQKIDLASEVRVLLDPDYSPEAGYIFSVKVSKAEAKAIVGRAGKEAPPTGVVDANGVLVLYPHNA